MRIKQCDVHVRSMARECSAAQRLMQLMGIGKTAATAISAMVGNASEFSSLRPRRQRQTSFFHRVMARVAVHRLDRRGE